MPYHIPSSISQQIRREVAPSPDSQYGKEARIQVSLLMLYPKSYIEECEFLKDAPLVKNLKEDITYSFNIFYSRELRTTYIAANEAIIQNFKENFVSFYNIEND